MKTIANVSLNWLLLFGAFVCPTAFSACLPGWLEMNGNCYMLLNSETAVNACTCSLRKVCWDRGGELISVADSVEEFLIFQIINAMYPTDAPKKMLLGFTDLDNEGTFEWLDGTAVGYTNWKVGSPDDGGPSGTEDCVAIETPTGTWDATNAKWIDIPCCFNELAITLTLCKADASTTFSPPAFDAVADVCFGNCPLGWWALGTDRCYSVVEKYGQGFTNPETARAKCREYGGDLPILDTPEALAMALAIMRSTNRTAKPTTMFLGLTDLEQEDSFVWVDGSSYVPDTPMTINKDDTISSQNCVVMTSSDDQWAPSTSVITWSDVNCCDSHAGVTQALCTRPVGTGDYDFTIPDLIKYSCGGVYCPRGGFSMAGYGYCYNYIRDTMTFSDAKSICSAMEGSDMESILSENEQSLVQFITNPNDLELWLGLHDPTNTDVWEWTDGSSVSFDKFAPSEPDGLPGDGNCVSMDPSQGMQWTDTDCGRELPFMCRRKVMYSMY